MNDLTKILEGARELLMLLSFAFGAFKSTPEGRKRRAAIKRQKAIGKWRKERYGFIKNLRKDRGNGRINEEQLAEKRNTWDIHNPEPK